MVMICVAVRTARLPFRGMRPCKEVFPAGQALHSAPELEYLSVM